MNFLRKAIIVRNSLSLGDKLSALWIFLALIIETMFVVNGEITPESLRWNIFINILAPCTAVAAMASVIVLTFEIRGKNKKVRKRELLNE